MIVGIGLIGTVSATVAAFFVNRRNQSSTRDADMHVPTNHDELIARLDELSAQQAEIRAMLERLSPG